MQTLARALFLCSIVTTSCHFDKESLNDESPILNDSPMTTESLVLFEEAAEAHGLVFTHVNGMNGTHYFSEMMGPGCAFLDYDNDGDLDVFVVQGHQLGSAALAEVPSGTYHQDDAPKDRLFRNDLRINADGSYELRFTDVTLVSGLNSTGYGMGVAVADMDNDGWVDIYVSNWGPNTMWRNNGDGTWSDCTEESGTKNSGWSTSCGFFDINHDDLVDLYVANYVDYDEISERTCYSASSAPDYCSPANFEPQSDALFLNLGNGRFQDITTLSGIGAKKSPGLGVTAGDFNGDNHTDIYVANDGRENYMWQNLGNNTFKDVALMAGCSVNVNGMTEAGMGAVVEDIDGDGDDDIFVTHLDGETNTLYRNQGQGTFDDVTASYNLSAPSVSFTGFGTGFFDYDNDGYLDFFVANGSVTDNLTLVRKGDPFPIHAINHLFHNQENRKFENVTAVAGAAFEISDASRGVALGDVDNDGDVDILVSNVRGPTRLYLNQVGTLQNWIGFRLVHGMPARDALGSRVTVILANGHTMTRCVRTDGSYCSARDPRVHFGIGKTNAIKSVRIRWPDGMEQILSNPPINGYMTLNKNKEGIPHEKTN